MIAAQMTKTKADTKTMTTNPFVPLKAELLPDDAPVFDVVESGKMEQSNRVVTNR